MAKTHIPKMSRLAGPLIPTYSCKECQKEFGSIHYLKIHMNNVHESSNSVQSADDELDPLEFMKVELHEGKGGVRLEGRSKIQVSNTVATDGRKACPKCGKVLKAGGLSRHMEDVHTVSSGYKCAICGSHAKSRNSLSSHMSIKHRGVSFKNTPLLPISPPIDAELASTNQHSTPRPFKSQQRISPRLNMKLSKLNHVSVISAKKNVERPTARKSTGGHRPVKNISKEVAIKMENHSTTTTKELSLATTLKIGKNDRDCPKCGKVLASGSGLKKHIEDRHTASDGFACAVCGKWNKTRNSLGTHMSRAHRGISAKNFPGLPCSKSDAKSPSALPALPCSKYDAKSPALPAKLLVPKLIKQIQHPIRQIKAEPVDTLRLDKMISKKTVFYPKLNENSPRVINVTTTKPLHGFRPGHGPVPEKSGQKFWENQKLMRLDKPFARKTSLVLKPLENLNNTFPRKAAVPNILKPQKENLSGTLPIPKLSVFKGQNLEDLNKTADENGNVPCPECGKMLKVSSLTTHIDDRHTDSPGYSCALCGSVCRSRNSLNSHMSRSHRGIKSKDVPMNPIGKDSPLNAKLKKMMKKQKKKLAAKTQFLPHTIKTEHEEIRIGNTFSLSDSNAYVNSDYEMSTASETDPFAEITIDDDDQMCQEIITAFASDPLNISPNFTQSKTIDENEIKIKIEPIQIYENSTTPKYGNKRLQGFRPGFGQGNVRDLAGQLKPKALYQKNTSVSPMIKLSCGKTQNDTATTAQQPLDYTKCVICEFSPTLGSDSANKPQMRDHYITKHFKEKSYDFLKQNQKFNPPHSCHIKDCHYSTKNLRDKIELLRHYARNHGMLERFYGEEFNIPVPENNIFTINDLEETEKNKNVTTDSNLKPFLGNLILESLNLALNGTDSEQKKCDICDKEFNSSDELSAHTDFHVKCSTVAHLCTDCDVAFFKISEYVSHNIDVHKSSSTSHKCDISCKKYELSSDFEKYNINQFRPKKTVVA